jgi:hypothetical protein
LIDRTAFDARAAVRPIDMRCLDDLPVRSFDFVATAKGNNVTYRRHDRRALADRLRLRGAALVSPDFDPGCEPADLAFNLPPCYVHGRPHVKAAAGPLCHDVHLAGAPPRRADADRIHAAAVVTAAPCAAPSARAGPVLIRC